MVLRSHSRLLAFAALTALAASAVAPPLVPQAHAEDAVASGMSKQQLLDALSVKYKDLKALRADVTQTQRNPVFGDETVQARLLVKQPGKMRWAFGAGDQAKLFVTDGVKMWVYTAEDKQVIVYDDISGQRGATETMLTSLDKLEEKFLVNVVSSNATGHVVQLEPKADDAFKRVVIHLGAALGVDRVVITDTFDNVTELDLKNVELNPSVDDKEFVFTPPTGVSVIRETN